MTTADNRRRRLDVLIREKYRSQAEFIRQTGENQGAISAILKGVRPFGEKKAREIERKAGIDGGWLDRADDSPATRSGDESRAPTVYDPTAGTGEMLRQAEEFAARAGKLREMQIAQASAVLAALSDGALSKALGLLLDLKSAETAQTTTAQAEPSELPKLPRKKKVIEFTGHHPSETTKKRGTK